VVNQDMVQSLKLQKNAKAKMRAIEQEYSDYVVSVFALVIYYIHLQDKN